MCFDHDSTVGIQIQVLEINYALKRQPQFILPLCILSSVVGEVILVATRLCFLY